jgi:hypothetical protein
VLIAPSATSKVLEGPFCPDFRVMGFILDMRKLRKLVSVFYSIYRTIHCVNERGTLRE